MKRIVNIAKSHKEADEWDILQQIKLSPAERQKIAKRLKLKFYGKNANGLREYYNNNNDR